MSPASRPGQPPARWLRATLLLVFVLMGCLALRQASSGDVGFHLAAGEYILEGNGWPRTDPFTFTVSDHPYIDTSWGYQVVLALLERAGGAPGFVVFHTGLVVLMLSLVYRTARLAPVEPCTLLVLLLLGGLACEMRFDVRPEVLSYTFLAWVLYLVHRHAEGLRSPLWLLPPTFLLWVNAHSLFVLGWIALACFALGLLVRDRRFDRRLLGWSAGSVAVSFVNPYGWKAIAFPLTLVTRFKHANVFNETIGEFTSAFDLGLSTKFPFYPRVPIHSFYVLFALTAIALLVLLRRRRWWCALLWLPFAYLSFKMVRNIPLLVVACLPGTAWSISLERIAAWLRLRAPTRGTLLRVVTVGVAAAAILLTLRVYNDAYYIASRRQDRFGTGWNRLTQPMAGTSYAERGGLDGPVLNHLNFGGYLIWARSRPVFIDGRLEVMGERFFSEYRKILGAEHLLEAAVDRYGIEWVVFPYRVGPSLLRHLSGDARWTLAYVDPLAAIFARSARLDPTRVDATALEAQRRAEFPPAVTDVPGLRGMPRRSKAAHWLSGLARRERFPTEPFYLGLFHYWRGETEAAASRFAEAIRASDGVYFEIYQNLGSALYRLGRYDDAAECYRIVLEERPSFSVARQRLADIERRLSAPPAP